MYMSFETDDFHPPWRVMHLSLTELVEAASEAPPALRLCVPRVEASATYGERPCKINSLMVVYEIDLLVGFKPCLQRRNPQTNGCEGESEIPSIAMYRSVMATGQVGLPDLAI